MKKFSAKSENLFGKGLLNMGILNQNSQNLKLKIEF